MGNRVAQPGGEDVQGLAAATPDGGAAAWGRAVAIWPVGAIVLLTAR
ncbi:hypothetical protein [uncultured Adlercreutzia sp.]|nr:hypothetical protein [uncultured Adlercreutzia sp.]